MGRREYSDFIFLNAGGVPFCSGILQMQSSHSQFTDLTRYGLCEFQIAAGMVGWSR